LKKGVFLVLCLFLFLVLPFPSVFADGWVSPDSHIECDWTGETYAYDESLETMATSDYFGTDEYSDYLVLTLDSSITSNKLRFYAWNEVMFPPYNYFWIELKVGLGSADTLVYFGDFTRKVWTEKSFSEATIDRMSVRFYGMYSGGYNHLYEVDFWEIEEAPSQYELNLNSIPFQNVNFTLNGTTYQTNYTDTLDEGYYNVTFPSVWVNNSITYVFKNWSDRSTNPSRIINLNANTTLTVTYVLPSKIPVLFVGACVIGGLIGFVFILSRKKR